MLKTLFLALTLVAFTPFVHAHGGCPPDDDESTVNINGQFYLADDSTIYMESNGLPGLQRSGGSCEDENGRTRFWSGDAIFF